MASSLGVQIINASKGYLRLMKDFDIPTPVAALVALTGVKGLRIPIPVPYEIDEAIGRDWIKAPDVMFQSPEDNQARVPGPAFDATWYATGYARSMSYSDGEWKGPVG